MVSRILALFAVVALLGAPLNAAAAQLACDHMAMMGPSAATSSAVADAGGDPQMPCCDPRPSHTVQACLAACVVMAGMVADLPQPPRVRLPAFVWTGFVSVADPALRSHPPPTFERPPRTHA